MSFKSKINVAVIGATGYTGLDLIYILAKHPYVKLEYLCATRNIGKKISHFDKRIKKKLPKISKLEKVKWDNLDIVFLSLPNGEAQKIIKKTFYKYKNLKYIDLSADFRLTDIKTYFKNYKRKHSANEFQSSLENLNITISPPSQKIGEIQSRVNVRGKFTGQWGPLPNHYSEPVLGAMISVSGMQITIEESEPNAYPSLHNYSDGEVIIVDALPGVWRGNPRLYLDNKSKIICLKSSGDDVSMNYKITRIGLMRTRANVEGVVISIDKRSGVKLDEKPWSMLNLHIWDGEHVAEVVAFGSSITSQMMTIRPGNKVKIVSAELGWRSGLPQLRIDQRSTRVTLID